MVHFTSVHPMCDTTGRFIKTLSFAETLLGGVSLSVHNARAEEQDATEWTELAEPGWDRLVAPGTGDIQQAIGTTADQLVGVGRPCGDAAARILPAISDSAGYGRC